MTVLAHLSDLHLIERDHHKRTGLARRRLAFLSAGSPLDAEARLQRAAATLQAARRAHADHVLITGDLTEDGSFAQFETLAEVLHASGLDPEIVTIVPGNHDGYGKPGTFARALQGPLRAFQATSRPGSISVLAEAVITPVSTMLEGQWITHSRGFVRDEDVFAVRRLASDTISRGRAVVVAQHHPPSQHPMFALEWIDGVKNGGAMRDLLFERTRVHVIHGHVHRHNTKRLSGRSHAQVFSTASVRDEFARGLSLRLYRAQDGTLQELTANVPLSQPATASAAKPAALGLAAAAG
jgi:3',5'-cyclic AMP phosphodiesterase CpdA